MGAPVRTGMGMVVHAIQDLARARNEVMATVDGLVGTARDADAGMAALRSSVEDQVGRLRALERTVQKMIDRLTGKFDSRGPELKASGAATGRPDGVAGDTANDASPPGELLDGLERQLQQAEWRLAGLTTLPAGERHADR